MLIFAAVFKLWCIAFAKLTAIISCTYYCLWNVILHTLLYACIWFLWNSVLIGPSFSCVGLWQDGVASCPPAVWRHRLYAVWASVKRTAAPNQGVPRLANQISASQVSLFRICSVEIAHFSLFFAYFFCEFLHNWILNCNAIEHLMCILKIWHGVCTCNIALLLYDLLLHRVKECL